MTGILRPRCPATDRRAWCWRRTSIGMRPPRGRSATPPVVLSHRRWHPRRALSGDAAHGLMVCLPNAEEGAFTGWNIRLANMPGRGRLVVTSAWTLSLTVRSAPHQPRVCRAARLCAHSAARHEMRDELHRKLCRRRPRSSQRDITRRAGKAIRADCNAVQTRFTTPLGPHPCQPHSDNRSRYAATKTIDGTTAMSRPPPAWL